LVAVAADLALRATRSRQGFAALKSEASIDNERRDAGLTTRRGRSDNRSEPRS
jgi:hypothetical protein